jgi:hypothetical protein
MDALRVPAAQDEWFLLAFPAHLPSRHLLRFTNLPVPPRTLSSLGSLTLCRQVTKSQPRRSTLFMSIREAGWRQRICKWAISSSVNRPSASSSLISWLRKNVVASFQLGNRRIEALRQARSLSPRFSLEDALAVNAPSNRANWQTRNRVQCPSYTGRNIFCWWRYLGICRLGP